MADVVFTNRVIKINLPDAEDGIRSKINAFVKENWQMKNANETTVRR